MASKEEVKLIIHLCEENKPDGAFKKIPSGEKGIGFIMSYLNQHGGKGYTNELANQLGISTARISTLINKLEKRGLLKREPSVDDARKTIIVMSDKGFQLEKERKEKVEDLVAYLIDNVGMESLISFIHTGSQIKTLVQQRIKETFIGEEK